MPQDGPIPRRNSHLIQAPVQADADALAHLSGCSNASFGRQEIQASELVGRAPDPPREPWCAGCIVWQILVPGETAVVCHGQRVGWVPAMILSRGSMWVLCLGPGGAETRSAGSLLTRNHLITRDRSTSVQAGEELRNVATCLIRNT